MSGPDPLKYVRGRAASWWRRTIMQALGLIGGVSTMTGCGFTGYRNDTWGDYSDVDGPTYDRQYEWELSRSESQRLFPNATLRDAEGANRWRIDAPQMASRLAPADRRLRPYYVPTLFQSMSSTAAMQLQQTITPILTPEMQRAFAGGAVLRDILAGDGWPTDTALIVDLPGPSSVAFAAVLSDRFTPVFTFDNWPHVYGVVPSHQTLAATLYYLPIFERTQSSRARGAPPMFVLDSNRLRPYTDDASQFDNRYVAKMPAPETFMSLGIRRVLYVTSDGTQQNEMDDLNDAFLALDQAGIDIRIAALTDFFERTDAALFRLFRLFRLLKPLKRLTMFWFDGQDLLASNNSSFLNPARSGSYGRFHGGSAS